MGAGGDPEEPSISSSHNKGEKGKDPKKDIPPKKNHRDESRTGSNHAKEDKDKEDQRNKGDRNRQRENTAPRRHRDEPPRKDGDRLNMPPPPPPNDGGNRGKHVPPHQSRSRTPPGKRPSQGPNNDEPRHSRSRASVQKPLPPSDARTRLKEIKAAKEDQYIGPKCFGPAIRKEVLPSSMSNVKKTCDKYNGTTSPETWLSDYIIAVGINDGNYLSAARFLPLILEGTAILWIDGLPEKTIHNWPDMQQTFIQHFNGTYKRPRTLTDLQRCVQQKDELTRDFVARWIEMKNSCERVSESQAMHAFKESLGRGLVRFMLQSHDPANLGDLLDLANKYAGGEDDARLKGAINMENIINPDKKSQKRKHQGNEQAGPSNEVAAAFSKGSTLR